MSDEHDDDGEEMSLPGLDLGPRFDRKSAEQALAAMLRLAACLGIDQSKKDWMDDVFYRVNGIVFSAHGELFIGEPSEFLRDLRTEENRLRFRIESLVSLERGFCRCPKCGRTGPLDCNPQQTHVTVPSEPAP